MAESLDNKGKKKEKQINKPTLKGKGKLSSDLARIRARIYGIIDLYYTKSYLYLLTINYN